MPVAETLLSQNHCLPLPGQRLMVSKPERPGLRSILVCGALLSGRQEHRESRARREPALHALPCQRRSTGSSARRCLPGWFCLSSLCPSSREEDTRRRGGMANRSSGRARNTGSSLSHPRPRAQLITKREQPKTSSQARALQQSLPRF